MTRFDKTYIIGVIILIVVVLLVASCGEKGSVQKCTDQKVAELQRGEVVMGWHGDCAGLSTEQQDQVDQAVADRL
jgi:hypothetical protein